MRNFFSDEHLARLSMDPEYVVSWQDPDGFKQRLAKLKEIGTISLLMI